MRLSKNSRHTGSCLAVVPWHLCVEGYLQPLSGPRWLLFVSHGLVQEVVKLGLLYPMRAVCFCIAPALSGCVVASSVGGL
eukprot:contig_33272_g8039